MKRFLDKVRIIAQARPATLRTIETPAGIDCDERIVAAADYDVS
jgi:hypothetical protein